MKTRRNGNEKNGKAITAQSGFHMRPARRMKQFENFRNILLDFLYVSLYNIRKRGILLEK